MTITLDKSVVIIEHSKFTTHLLEKYPYSDAQMFIVRNMCSIWQSVRQLTSARYILKLIYTQTYTVRVINIHIHRAEYTGGSHHYLTQDTA